MSSLWTPAALRDFMTRSASIDDTRPGTPEERAAILGYMDAAVAEARQNQLRLPKNLVPSNTADLNTAFWCAVVFASGGRILPEQVDFLCNAPNAARWQPMASAQGIVLDMGDIDAAIMSGQVEIPSALYVDPEAVKLASAFCQQMIEKAYREGREPITGEFVMRKPFDLPLIDELKFDHLRLVVSPKGVYFSFIFEDGSYTLSWWSPERDALIPILGRRFAWLMRTFMACFWHDAKVVRYKAMSVKQGSDTYGSAQKPPVPQTLVLPRVLRELVWAEDEKHVWQSRAVRSNYSVRAHYRELAPGWKMSDNARDNAELAGFPEPPPGYTFVQAYAVGTPEERAHRPRIVCKGFQAAKVALATL